MNVQMPKLDLPLNDKAECSFTLPSEYYLSQEIFEQEKNAIFYKTWQYIAHESMLPNVGDYITLKICDENIFVMRAPNNELKAFYNICRHRAHELLEGQGNVKDAIICPYHAWSYNLDGSLNGARMSQHRPEFKKADFGLKEVRLEKICGFLFVNLDDNAESLSTIAKGLEEDIYKHVPYVDDLKLAGTDVFGETFTKAGWKVVVDNFVECYHCLHAHPDFSSIIKMNKYEVDVNDYWSRQLGPEIRHENSAYNVDPEKGAQGSVFWYLWPNTTFNVMPGADEMAVFAVRPDEVETSFFGGHTFTKDGVLNQARADYVADILVPEDIGLCESVQRGLKSKSYDQGPFIVDDKRSGTGEHALHHFHRLVQQALEI